MRQWLSKIVVPLALLVCLGPGGRAQRRRPPIIDVHLHAFPVDLVGPGTLATSPGTIGLDFRVPGTDAENLKQTLAALREYNIVKAVVSGRLDRTRDWVAADPQRLIPGITLGDPVSGHSLEEVTPDRIFREHQTGRLAVLGEITAQYVGISPADPRLDPYFRVAEEADIPVHIHTAGVGYGGSGFRSAMGRPLLLEEVLVRHPNLRIYLENAGYPFLDEMLALFYQYPDRVYADMSTLIRIVPREEFYRYLKTLVVAGYGERIMFGSDQVLWPQTIGLEIQILDQAPFLNDEQKRDIFYNNAVRFFRLERSLRQE